jgi:hypothetical protein
MIELAMKDMTKTPQASNQSDISIEDARAIEAFLQKHKNVNVLSPRQWLWVLWNHKLTWRLLRYVKSLPNQVVYYDDKIPPPTTIPGFSWRRPTILHGFARSCVLLPENREDYFRGTAKQNLRTRTSGATRKGYVTRELANDEIFQFVSSVCIARGWHEFDPKIFVTVTGRDVLDLRGVGTFSAEGTPVAFAIGTQAGDGIALKWAYSTDQGHARWQCFSGLVDYCYEQKLRTIIEDPRMFIERTLLVFQKDLGFIDANVQLRRRPTSRAV